MFFTRSSKKAKWIHLLVEKYERQLLRYAARLLGNPEGAREVVQDTFLKLWEADMKDVESHPAEWLFKVCRNRMIDLRRKEKHMKPLFDLEELERLPDGAPLAANVVEMRQEGARILQLLAGLSANQQEVIRLKFQNGLSYREISSITGHTVSNVGVLIHTAVKQIRAQMKEVSNEKAQR